MPDYENGLRNARMDLVTAAAGDAALLTFWGAPRPAPGGTPAGTNLGHVVCGTPFAQPASGGVLSLYAIADGVGIAEGTIAFARLTTAGGGWVADYSVGVSGAEVNLLTTAMAIGQPISITSGVGNEGNP